MSFPTDITKVVFAGDWHDNFKYMWHACYWAHQKGAEAIVQVGDFGFWTNGRAYDDLNDQLKKWNLQLFFIDGNHENFPLLYSIPVNSEGVRPIRSNITHLPRGFRWEWYGRTFTALGGAHSIDEGWRIDGQDWFKEEDITPEDMVKVMSGGLTDFLITHDAPISAPVPLDPSFAASFNQDIVAQCEMNRWMLEKVCRHVKPLWLIHGHYHVDYGSYVNWWKDKPGKVTGLHCDGNAFNKNMMVVDLTEVLY